MSKGLLLLKIHLTQAQICQGYHICEKSHFSGNCFFYVLASCRASLLSVSVPRKSKCGLLHRLKPLGPPYIQIDLSALNWNAQIHQLTLAMCVLTPWCRRFQTAKKDKMAISQHYDVVCSMQRNLLLKHTLIKG